MVRMLKQLALVVTFSAGSLALVGCTSSVTTNPTTKPTGNTGKSITDKVGDAVKDATKDVKETVKDAKDKGKEVVDNAADALVKKAKEAFTGPLTAMLGDAEKSFTKYEEDAKTAKDDVKKGLTEKATKGKELVGKIKEKITALMAAPGDKWEAIKAEIEKMVTELKGYLPGAAAPMAPAAPVAPPVKPKS